MNTCIAGVLARCEPRQWINGRYEIVKQRAKEKKKPADEGGRPSVGDRLKHDTDEQKTKQLTQGGIFNVRI